MINFLLISYFTECNAFSSLADPHPQPDVTEVGFALIRRFSLLSKDQRSYRSVLTPDRLRMHSFYPSSLGKVIGILDSTCFALLVF